MIKPDYYRDGQVFHQVGSDGQYRLEIPNVKLDYTGTYGVLAENIHGDTKAIISLQVFAKGQGKEKAMDTKIFGAIISRPKVLNGLENLRCCDGDSVTFECQVQVVPPNDHDISWFRNNRLIKLDSDMKPEVQVDSKENLVIARLKIPHVYPEDEGEFTCRVANELGEVVTSACLIVDVPEEKENSLSVKLTRPSGLMSGHSTPRSTPRSTPPRSISPLSSRTFTPYSLNSAIRARRLTSSPRFYAVPHNKICDLGDTVRFQCSVTGQPAPWTSWSKDGKPATPNARVTIREKEDLRFLEISEVTLEDAGLYTIKVENNYGSVEATARLEIMGHHGVHTGTTVRSYSANRSSPSFGRRLVGSTARVGGQFTLSADIQASPSPATSWYKDGELLVKSDKVTPTWDGKVARLELDNLEISDSGIYTCIAENEIGKTRCSAELSVLNTPDISDAELQPPVFETGLPNRITIREGITYEMTVKIAGSQPLDVIWTKDSAELVNCSDFKYVDYGDGRYGLRFLDTFLEDSGIYTCEAFNEHGDATTTTTLVVGGEAMEDDTPLETSFANQSPSHTESKAHTISPATIIGRPTDISVMRGSTAVLKTDFIGEPLPEIKWDKGGKDLTSDGRLNIITVGGTSVLTIEDITGDDSGKYQVHVSNQHGSDSCYASVAVEGIPDPPSGAIGVSNNRTSVVITWSSPPYDGGCMITGYVVEMKAGTQPWVELSERCHSLSHAIHDLTPGQSYVFRVRAENVHGLSLPSSESTPVQVLNEVTSPPFEPRTVALESGDKFYNSYQILEELGKGRYGTVHQVVLQETKQILAAKFVRCISSKDREKVHEEIDIMNSLRHPKLLQLFSAYENQKHVVMVMEYIGGGELFERVVADDFTLTERDCVLFLRQICEGVDYMHRNNIVHLDLKPENIMCVSRTSHHIKIIDFGLAQKINPDYPPRVLFGTPEFIPPEIINYEPIGIESDMWSIGVITYVLLSGLSPFMGENDSETFANITRAEFDFDDEAFEALSEDAKDFISSLLVKRKEKRLTAKQCLSHLWIAQKDSSPGVNKIISTDKLKKYIYRRKWQKTGNALLALRKMAKMARERYEKRRTSTATTSSSCSSGSSTGFNSPRPSVAFSRMSSLNEDETDLVAKLKLVNEAIAKTTDDDRQGTRKIHDKSVRYSDEIFEIAADENTETTQESKTNVRLKSIMKTNSKEYEHGEDGKDDKASGDNGTSSDTSHDTVIARVVETKLEENQAHDIVQNGLTQDMNHNGLNESSEQTSVGTESEELSTSSNVSGIKIVGSIDKVLTEENGDEKNSNSSKITDNTGSGFNHEKSQKNINLDKVKSLQDIRGRMCSDRSDSGFSESSVGKLDHVTVEPKTSKVQALSNKFKNKELNQTTKQQSEVGKIKLKHSTIIETEKERKNNKVNSLLKKTEIFEPSKTKQEDKVKKSTIQSNTDPNKRSENNTSIAKNLKIDQLSKTSGVRDQSPSRYGNNNKSDSNLNVAKNQKIDQLNKTTSLRDQSPSRHGISNKFDSTNMSKNPKVDQVSKTGSARDQSPSRYGINNKSDSSIAKHSKMDQLSKTSGTRDQSPSRLNMRLKQFQSNVKTNNTDSKLNNKTNVIMKNKVQENPFIKQQNLTNSKPQLSKLKTQTSQDNTTPPGSPTTKSDSANKYFGTRKQTPLINKANISPQNSKTNMTTDIDTLTRVDKVKPNNAGHIETSNTVTTTKSNEKTEHVSRITKTTEQKSSSIFNRVHSKISTDLLSKFEQPQGNTETKLVEEMAGSQNKEVKSVNKTTHLSEESGKDTYRSRSKVESNREASLTRVSNNSHVSTKSVESKLITNSVFHTKHVINNNNDTLTNNNLPCLDKTIKSDSTTQEHGLVEHDKFKFKATFGTKESTGAATDVHSSSFQKKVAFWNR
ncbi:hypothetical protein M8J76_011412 [Diaphorina citri]|nr:hypothetical protein M8J76_011412 [Diaphorina citri]